MPRTYEPIATATLTTATSTVTFSGIPNLYTDLVWVSLAGQTSAQIIGLRFNNDSSTNYSSTRISANGSSYVGARASSEAQIRLFNWGIGESSSVSMASVGSIMSYSNTNIYKTTIDSWGRAAGGVGFTIGLWRSTNAVNRVDFVALSTDTFVAGSTFSIYGIKAA